MPTDFFSGEEYKPWTLAQIYADLGAREDIAIALNVDPRRVKGWIDRRETSRCPMPVFKAGKTHVYSISEWQGWFHRFLETHHWLKDYCLEHPAQGDMVRRFFGE